MSESQSADGFDVGLTLRDRIAKILWRAFQDTTPPCTDITEDQWERWWNMDDGEGQRFCYYEQADAVIAALKQEWRADFGYDGYADTPDREEAEALVEDFNTALGDDFQDGEQAVVMCRFVTDWENERDDDDPYEAKADAAKQEWADEKERDGDY